MANELNGTYTVLNNTTGEIEGQGEFTHTYGGALIEISNKSYGDTVVYLDGELSGKQHIFAGSFTYNAGAQFRKARYDSFVGTQDTYTLTLVGSGATTDESFTGLFVPTALSDTIPAGASVTTSLSFNSSGDIAITEAVT